MKHAFRRAMRATHEMACSAGLLACLAMVSLGVVASLASVARSQTNGSHLEQAGGRSLTILPMQTHEGLTDLSQDESSRPQHRHYYGVLGAVNRPGVYVTDDSQLTLAALVEAAQGPAQNATEMASIVRHGRAGLKLRYLSPSAQRLLPGDVVIVGRRQLVPSDTGNLSLHVASHNASVETASHATTVAFVGLVNNRPIVSSLHPNATTLPRVLADLYQQPEVIRSTQVIRSTISPADADFDPTTDSLLNGDVIVFDPVSIDRTKFGRTDAYPPAIPISSPTGIESAERPLSSPAHPAIGDGLQVRQLPMPLAITGNPLKASASVAPDEPVRNDSPDVMSLSPPSLRAPSFPEFEPETPADDNSATRLANSDPLRSATPTDVKETPVAPISLVDSTPGENPVLDTDPLPTLVRLTPAPAEPQRTSAEELAEESFDRIALQGDAGSSSSATVPQESLVERNIPMPVESSRVDVIPILRSRATMLGLGVLVVAVLCLIGSLLWSKLDETSGRIVAEHDTSANEDESVTLPAGGQTLNRLIANKLPMIEEETSLPERLSFHGEAVGRRRIRMDSKHEIAGPHFSAATGPEHITPDTHDIPENAPATDRIDDAPPQSSSSVAEASRHTTESNRKHGLLERVLVAMEREKRR